MTTAMIPSNNDAARTFVRMLIPCVYEGTIRAMRSLLENGPPGKKPAEELVQQHKWFESLRAEDRDMVVGIVREAVEFAVFQSLVLLDRMTGGYPIKGQPSEFGLYLQIYDDEEARIAGTPATSIRINCSKVDHMLHDLFKMMLSEHSE